MKHLSLIFSLLFEALRLPAPGRFYDTGERRVQVLQMQTWQAENTRNTRFGTNRGRLPRVFRRSQAVRRLQ